MIILITGGAGFVGSHLVDYLDNVLTSNDHVIVMDDFSNGNYRMVNVKYNLTY